MKTIPWRERDRGGATEGVRCGPTTESLVGPTCSGAVAADLLRGVGEAAAVADKEATGEVKFVGLLGDDADGKFLTGTVGAGQFEGLGDVSVFDVHERGLCVVPAGGEVGGYD